MKKKIIIGAFALGLGVFSLSSKVEASVSTQAWACVSSMTSCGISYHACGSSLNEQIDNLVAFDGAVC